MVGCEGGREAVPLWSPFLGANYDCWFLLVSWGLVWGRRQIVAQTRNDSATMAINEEGSEKEE